MGAGTLAGPTKTDSLEAGPEGCWKTIKNLAKMPNYNKVVLIGNLTDDPQQNQSGTYFSVAVNEKWVENGDKQCRLTETHAWEHLIKGHPFPDQ